MAVFELENRDDLNLTTAIAESVTGLEENRVPLLLEDLRKGEPLQASEFATHLDQVVEGRAPKDYQEPERFFARTCMTARIKELAKEALRRLYGETVGCSPVITLTTQFGGGKTHGLVLLHHCGDAVRSSKGPWWRRRTGAPHAVGRNGVADSTATG